VIGLDSSVLVRYFAQDEPQQALLATDLIEGLTEESPGYVSLVALVELDWVLRRSYRAPVDDRVRVVRGLLGARDIVVQDADAVQRAIGRVRGGVDLADALIHESGSEAGCIATATFDRRLSQLPEVRLLS
jgi:predicted nucleic-acid-binding protein